MKKITTLLFVLITASFFAQIRGTVTDNKNKPLPFVSVYLDGTVTGTTTNDNGEYRLPINKKGKHIVVFQFLGYKTVKKSIDFNSSSYVLDVKLTEEEVILKEVLISSEENPANKIIRQVIANKEKNTDKQANFTADYYSRGLIKIKNAPKKILGQQLGDFGGGLDSTRSGIIYLSETISKIKFQKKPKNFKEHIIASKVSGSDNGISFNQAKEVYYNLYDNLIPIGNEANIFSPIADYAFGYYQYKLEGAFYDKNGNLINKIKLLPRRKNDRVFEGFIYIVEDSWAVYGADLTLTGEQMNNPAISLLKIKQNYNYSKENDTWVQILQTLDFDAGLLGIKLNGRYSAVYSNYNFNPNFSNKTFDNQVLSFAKEATKKDSVYWNKLRPVPLTSEETKDYLVKDSLKILRKSETYLDSIDATRNKFKILSPIMGYTYRNSYKKGQLNYTGLLNNVSFNTIQGFNVTLDLNYYKRQSEDGKRLYISGYINYGFSDKRIRPNLSFTKQWNNTTRPVLNISTGIKTAQFDDRNPISDLVNSGYSLVEKENYMKLYEKTYASASFSREAANGIRFFSTLEYAKRKPLFNTTDYSFWNKNDTYLTNNPINTASIIAPFNKHSIFTANVSALINFGNKYMSYPNFKINIPDDDYPTLLIGYRKTFGANNSELHSDFAYVRAYQNVRVGNLGVFDYNARAGIFIKQKNIAFMDYYHPMGNQTIFSPSNRMSSFNLLPYYQFSTNNKYAEIHAEHNFKGFILNKIPLLNKLNFHLVGGAKALFTADRKPYTEYLVGIDNIGWGKWRFLRVDYVRSNFNGQTNSGFVFGFNLFELMP